MKYSICCVRDSSADVFGVPMFLGSRGQAIRSFSDEVQRVADNNIMNRHPSDFELFFIGEFDDAQASFDLLPEPKSLIRGIDCVKAK